MKRRAPVSPHQTRGLETIGMDCQDIPGMTVCGWSGLIERVRHHSPEWADRFAGARTTQELKELVSNYLCGMRLVEELKAAIDGLEERSSPAADLSQAISRFLMANLHRGLTLKDLAKFLGYSEKYCSELFQSVMGEPFSRCMKRLRVAHATHLLRYTESSQMRIAARVGFSDQFAFSHFFKKAMGCSPKQFRSRFRKGSAVEHDSRAE